MAEFDPEAYLEATLTSTAPANIPPPPPLPANGAEVASADDERPSRRERSEERSKRRRSSRSRSRERKRERSRSRERKREKEREKERDRDRDRERRAEPKPRYDETYKYEKEVRSDSRSAAQKEEDGFERDLRTVFIAQVARKADERDLFAFFCECGKVTDVRIIKDSQTRRSKGIAYVEFEKQESCPLAVAKSGQIICGFPVVIQASQAEKNIAAKQAALGALEAERPAKIRVSNLHKDIGEDDLQALFSPFGTVNSAIITREHGPTNTGTVTFKSVVEAQKAVAHLNGFDLAGQPLVVQLVQEQPKPMLLQTGYGPAAEVLDDHELGGVQVTAQSRAALMAKLARGTELGTIPGQMGLSMPMPMPVMPMMPRLPPQPLAPAPPPPSLSSMANLPPSQPMPSDYMLLVNMFDPAKETEPDWHLDIQDDVEAECSKFGTVQKCVADRSSPHGLVYLKFDSSGSAVKAAQALNGRFFAGKSIAALFLSNIVFEKFLPKGT